MFRITRLFIPALLLIQILPVKAAEYIPVNHLTLNQLQQQIKLDTHDVKQAIVDTRSVLRVIRQHKDVNNVEHIRMQQQYAGFPVHGGYVILHRSQPTHRLGQATSVTMNGAIYRHLSDDLKQPASNYVQHGQQVLQEFIAQYETAVISDTTVKPLIYVDEQQQAHWAYKLSALIQQDNQIPQRPTAIIDAATATIFVQWNDLKTLRSVVHGVGYGGNVRIGKHQFGQALPFLELTRDDVLEQCYMENQDVRVVDMNHRYNKANIPAAFYCGEKTQYASNTYWTGYDGDGYDTYNQAYSPVNDALYAGNLIKTMYQSWYGVDVLTRRNKPMQLVMRVHFGNKYDNAFWDGQQMTFGDGDELLYPLASLSVGAHEVTHGFTEQHADLEYYGQSGGMNESFSDMAAQAAEFFAYGANDWLIGADVLREEMGKALRYMDRPSQDGRSIDSAAQYRPKMNVHHSSGVYNRLFYLLATQPHWDVRQAFHVMLKANMDYWTPNASFVDGACGVIHAAQDLHLSTDAVKKACEGVAIDYSGCI